MMSKSGIIESVLDDRKVCQSVVFISYKRNVEPTPEFLVEFLQSKSIQVLIDREDIVEGDEWESRITELIVEADSLIFLITRGAIHSKVCEWEVSEARRLGKRVIPIRVTQQVSDADLPEWIRGVTYLDLSASAVPNDGFARLYSALTTNVEWQRQLAELTKRWERWVVRLHPDDLLLRGVELNEAQTMLLRRPMFEVDLPEGLLRFIEKGQQAEQRALEEQRIAELTRLRERNEAAGAESLDRDDLPSALAWFADATRCMKTHPDWEQYEIVARLRLSSLLSQFPKLEYTVSSREICEAAALSHSEEWLAVSTVAVSGELRLTRWDLRTGLPLWTVDEGMAAGNPSISFPLHSHNPFLPQMAISFDDRWIVVTAMAPALEDNRISIKGIISVYDAETGQRVGDRQPAGGAVHMVQAAENDLRIATVTAFGDDGLGKLRAPGRCQLWTLSGDGVLKKKPSSIQMEGTLLDAAFSADLRRLVAATLKNQSGDGSSTSEGFVEIWDTVDSERLDNGQPRVTVPQRVAIDRDGRTFTEGRMGELLRFSVDPIEEISRPIASGRSTEFLQMFTDKIADVTRQDGAGYAISRGVPSQFSIWNADGARRSEPVLADSLIETVSFLKSTTDSDVVTLGTSDGDVAVVDAVAGRLTPWLPHQDSILLAEVTADRRLVVATKCGTITVWNLKEDGLQHRLRNSSLTVSHFRSSKLLDATNGQTAGTGNAGTLTRARQLALSPSGRWLATAGVRPDVRAMMKETNDSRPVDSNQLAIWDTSNERVCVGPLDHEQPLDIGAFSPNETLFCAIGCIFPKSVGTVNSPTTMSEGYFGSATFGEDPGHPASEPMSILWCRQVASGELTFAPATLPGRVGDLVFVDNHRLLVGGSSQNGLGFLVLLDLRTGRPIGEPQTAVQPIVKIRCRRCLRILTVGSGGACQVWKISDSGPQKCGDPITVAETRADISPDGHRIATGSYNRSPVTLYDLKSGQEPWKSNWHTDGITSVEFHPDEAWLLTASTDGWVAVWDFRDPWQIRQRIKINVGVKVQHATWSPDGRLIGVLDENFGSQAFECENGIAILGRHAPELLYGGGTLQFSHDSRKMFIFQSGHFGEFRPGRFYVRDIKYDLGAIDQLILAAERVGGLEVRQPEDTAARSVDAKLECNRSRVRPNMIRRELQANPKNSFLWYRLGQVLADQSNFEQGIEAYSEAIRLCEPSPPPYMLTARAQAYSRLQKTPFEIADRMRVLDLKTASFQDLNDVSIFLAISDPDALTPILNELQNRKSVSEDLYERLQVELNEPLFRGMAEATRGNYKAAQLAFGESRNNPFYSAVQQLAPAVLAFSDYFEVAAALASGDLDSYLTRCRDVGRNPEVMGSPVRAMWFARAAVLHPDSLDDFCIFAECTRKAVDDQPANAGRLVLHGKVLYRASLYEEACDVLKRSAELIEKAHELDHATQDASRQQPLIWLAMAQFQLGNLTTAKDTYAQGVQHWERMKAEDDVRFAPAGRSWLARLSDRLLLKECEAPFVRARPGLAAEHNQNP